MLFDGVCGFNETCGHGIDEVRRRGDPFAFGVFVDCNFGLSVVRYLGFGFEGL